MIKNTKESTYDQNNVMKNSEYGKHTDFVMNLFHISTPINIYRFILYYILFMIEKTYINALEMPHSYFILKILSDIIHKSNYFLCISPFTNFIDEQEKARQILENAGISIEKNCSFLLKNHYIIFEITKMSVDFSKDTTKIVSNIIENCIMIDTVKCNKTIGDDLIETIFMILPSFLSENLIYSVRTSVLFASICVVYNTDLKEIATIFLANKSGKWLELHLKINLAFEFCNLMLKVQNIALIEEEILFLRTNFIIHRLNQLKNKRIKIKVQHVSKINNDIDDSLICHNHSRNKLKKLGVFFTKYLHLRKRTYKCNDCKTKYDLLVNLPEKNDKFCNGCKKCTTLCSIICAECANKERDLENILETYKKSCCIDKFNIDISYYNYFITFENFFSNNPTDFLGIKIDNIYEYCNLLKPHFIQSNTDLQLFMKKIKITNERIANNPIIISNGLLLEIKNGEEVHNQIYEEIFHSLKDTDLCFICCEYFQFTDLLLICENENPVCNSFACLKCIPKLRFQRKNQVVTINTSDICPCCKRRSKSYLFIKY